MDHSADIGIIKHLHPQSNPQKLAVTYCFREKGPKVQGNMLQTRQQAEFFHRENIIS